MSRDVKTPPFLPLTVGVLKFVLFAKQFRTSVVGSLLSTSVIASLFPWLIRLSRGSTLSLFRLVTLQ